jgi:inositol-phosphate phosphatase / L-galactose 1-phosphate phosphatase / histidinol-phosphatase
MTDDLKAYVDLAGRLADAARTIALRYFRSGVAADTKSDQSPVTIADREAELEMRRLIEAAFPDHGIIGEELGTKNPSARHVWVLDPIDGTKSFVTGRPLFGTLIALCRDGIPVVGVMDCPAMDERWIGVTGQSTLYRGRLAPHGPVRTRACAGVADASLYCTAPDMFDAVSTPMFRRVEKAAKLRVFGGDCYAYALVASGCADLVIEEGLKPYDWAALVPILEGAGGKITDWTGGTLSLDTPSARVLAAGDTRVHSAARKLLEG